MKILADATLPPLTHLFPSPFVLSYYTNLNELHTKLPEHNILLCRSTLKITADLLRNTPIRYVATASSGTDHIDKNYLTTHNIQLFDAKGSNARAVADYVATCLAVLTTNYAWHGQRIGIIGYGCVGRFVAERLQAVGYSICVYDPPKARKSSIFHSCNLDELYDCDLISVHADLHNQPPYPSYHLINADFVKNLKENTVILNAARGGIVDEQALLTTSKKIIYCTDVYANEPNLNPAVLARATLCTPHIAGHSIEAKEQAIQQLSQQLHAQFNLAMPQYPLTTKNIALTPKTTWAATLLTIYDPRQDSQILKHTHDIPTAYREQRARHTLRHNFTSYMPTAKIPELQNWLGQLSDDESTTNKG